MIKPIEASELNISKKLYFDCQSCGENGIIVLEGHLINVDQDGNSVEPLDDYDCQKCGARL